MRYGDTAEMAATILEEGKNSPADVFFAQDAGTLGALASQGRLQALPQPLLDQVDPRFRDPAGRWAGASGRARVVAYNTGLTEADLPDSIIGFTDPQWRGRVGWAAHQQQLSSPGHCDAPDSRGRSNPYLAARHARQRRESL